MEINNWMYSYDSKIFIIHHHHKEINTLKSEMKINKRRKKFKKGNKNVQFESVSDSSNRVIQV